MLDETKGQEQKPSPLNAIIGRTLHELKIEARYFDAVLSGSKTFETRYNDRAFQKGDSVILRELGSTGKYTGRRICATIGFVLSDLQKEGYVTFSLLDVHLYRYED